MKINLIILNYICFNIEIIKCIFKLHFKKENLNEINTTNFFDYITENNYITNIKIGTPYQNITMQIKFSTNEFMIISKEKNGSYDNKNSKTYHQLEKDFEQTFDSKYFNKGIVSWDNIIFENNLEITNLSFILGTNILTNLKNGILGLKKTIKKYEINSVNFINLLKTRNIINSYSFHYFFNKDNSGEIIIGNYPHEYNNKIYDEENFKKINVIKNYDFINWNVQFDEIKFRNKYLNYDLNVSFNLDLGGIIVNEIIFDYFNVNYFDEYVKKNLCKIFYSNDKFYKGFYCDININIKKFPNLFFYHKELNYTFNLNYNDLFLKTKDKLFFLIIYRNNSNFFYWEFGEIFFKKYQFIFDEEKGIIGFYNSKKKIAINYSKIFIFMLFIFIVLLILFIFKIIMNKQRRLRANELEENYDYIQKIN